MSLATLIASLEKEIPDSKQGLPEEVFRFVSRLTPMVNVDLLIKDETGRTLLSWRADEFAGAGWHLPGGIIRFKEKIVERVAKVAETEIGAAVQFNPVPLTLNEVICDHDIRGHFISLLYQCSLSGNFIPANHRLTENDQGYLRWHHVCPKNLVTVHKMYERFIND